METAVLNTILVALGSASALILGSVCVLLGRARVALIAIGSVLVVGGIVSGCGLLATRRDVAMTEDELRRRICAEEHGVPYSDETGRIACASKACRLQLW